MAKKSMAESAAEPTRKIQWSETATSLEATLDGAPFATANLDRSRHRVRFVGDPDVVTCPVTPGWSAAKLIISKRASQPVNAKAAAIDAERAQMAAAEAAAEPSKAYDPRKEEPPK